MTEYVYASKGGKENSVSSKHVKKIVLETGNAMKWENALAILDIQEKNVNLENPLMESSSTAL